MGLLNEIEELEVFETKTIKELIEFKWTNYGKKHHIIGTCFHFFYILLMVVYINYVYILNIGTTDDQKLYSALLGIGVVYPCCYNIS